MQFGRVVITLQEKILLTIHLEITGKVQGVFFQASAKEMADKAGVTGWVKNTPEGRVEAMITGTKAQLKQFADWCKKGPAKAKVENVLVTEREETFFKDFEVIR